MIHVTRYNVWGVQAGIFWASLQAQKYAGLRHLV